MNKRINKKGAMELSINTIVIVVIGITLLVLGLVFVRGIFEKLGGLGEGAFQKAEQELKQIQAGDTKINFPATIPVKKGKSANTVLKICNTEGTLEDNSNVKLEPSGFYEGLSVTASGKVVQGTTTQTINLDVVEYQSCRPIPVIVFAKPTTAVDPNTNPVLTITVEKSGSIYDSIATIIEVT
ncbi:MAG: hypothetical protein KKA79_06290 [Nanoarchaeota archaeon]|nr:hypothetical protein [Nanoarchaeota archaeon]MCG2717808.1 hypothetical protein [Nanoarchaeota archaeon]